MKIRFECKISKIFPIETKQNEHGKYTTQQFLMDVQNGKYKNSILFNCWADKCKLIDKLSPGATVRVDFYIKSAISGNRYYTNLHVVDLETINNSSICADNEF